MITQDNTQPSVPSTTPARSAGAWGDRAIVLAAIAGLTTLAWLYVLHLGSAMGPADADGMAAMPGMDMSAMAAAAPAFRPWGLSGFALTFLMWAVMMIGMMLPSVTPMVWLYSGVARHGAGSGRALAATGWFVAGYLLVWSMFSVAATGAQWLLTRLALLSPRMASANAWLGGALLIGAGLYQWSPSKRACLSHCQTPLSFVLRHGDFRPGITGAVRQGAHHGAYCVGCCALLMSLLFVGGVMNVLWIAGLSILVLVEKIWIGPLVPRLAGVALVAAGLIVLAG